MNVLKTKEEFEAEKKAHLIEMKLKAAEGIVTALDKALQEKDPSVRHLLMIRAYATYEMIKSHMRAVRSTAFRPPTMDFTYYGGM